MEFNYFHLLQTLEFSTLPRPSMLDAENDIIGSTPPVPQMSPLSGMNAMSPCGFQLYFIQILSYLLSVMQVQLSVSNFSTTSSRLSADESSHRFSWSYDVQNST
eukprot:UN01628